jgi:hypothetical protein
MSYQAAMTHKNDIAAKGIPDAFVIAYYKGKKISLAEAERIQGIKLADIAEQKDINTVVTANIKVKEVYFCIQLVAYKKEIPQQSIKTFSDKINQGLNTYTTETGMHVLITKPVGVFQDALNLRQQVVTSGVADAFIVGFVDGKRVSAADARKALGQ